MKEGAVLAFRNGRSVVFKERMRLEIDRWGKISSEEVEIGDCDLKNNLSKIEYETHHVMVSGGKN